MPPVVARVILVVALIAVAAAPLAIPTAARARGEDSCNEPNDARQQACLIAPGDVASGFLFHAGDVDAFRIQALDFNVDARLELTEMPHPYRVWIEDWNGRELARSPDDGPAVSDLTLGPPGTYYLFVDSRDGDFSDDQAYRLTSRLTYPGPVPRLVYSREFRPGESRPFTDPTGLADYGDAGGQYTIAMKVGGSRREPRVAVRPWGPHVADFTATFDTRLAVPVDAGYRIAFRGFEASTFYWLAANPRDRQVQLSKFVDDEIVRIREWTPAPMLVQEGVNRTVVRAIGNELIVNVNGVEVIRASAGAIRSGDFTFGAIAWGDAPTLLLDDVVVTASDPTGPPGTVLLADSFDGPASGFLPTWSPEPARFTRSYEDGEYAIRKVDPTWDRVSSSRLPIAAKDASIAADIRVGGDPSAVFLTMTCRGQDTPLLSAYRVNIRPETGHFWLGRYDDDQYTTLADWRSTPVLGRGNDGNHVELSCVGSTIGLIVNGAEVASVSDTTYAEGWMSLGVGTASGAPATAEGWFDNLVVTQR